jgi:hypothetical protein
VTALDDQPMKLLIFDIAIVTLGAISQAKAAPIEFGEAKPYPRLVEGKTLLRPWELDWRRYTTLPRRCFVTRRVTTCGITTLRSIFIC